MKISSRNPSTKKKVPFPSRKDFANVDFFSEFRKKEFSVEPTIAVNARFLRRMGEQIAYYYSQRWNKVDEKNRLFQVVRISDNVASFTTSYDDELIDENR